MFAIDYNVSAREMAKKMKKFNTKLRELVELDREIRQLPKLSPIEKELLNNEIRFESTYFSNKLEGNKLSIDDAQKAVMG